MLMRRMALGRHQDIQILILVEHLGSADCLLLQLTLIRLVSAIILWLLHPHSVVGLSLE